VKANSRSWTDKLAVFRVELVINFHTFIFINVGITLSIYSRKKKY